MVNGSFEEEVRKLFRRECRRLIERRTALAHADFQPTWQLLQEMLQEPDLCGRSPDEVATAVRQRVLERTFCGEMGDAMVDAHFQVSIAEEVDLIVRVLAKVPREYSSDDAAARFVG